MRFLPALIVLLIAAAHLPPPARAEPATAAPSVQGLIMPTIVPPNAITCHDFRNRIVNIVDVRALGDAGRAEFIPGQGPVIMIDPELMATLPAKLQTFFKLHECGHHALGHLMAPSDRSEKDADCWAIQHGRDTGVFTRYEIANWLPFFAKSTGSIFGHLPGPQRVDFLLGCFDGNDPLKP